jgi:outer membrane protein
MKKAVYIFLITLISVQVNAQQQSVQSFSLQQAVEYAKKNNIALKNGQLDLRLAEKKVQETLAMGLPQISASANFTNNTTIASNVINFGGQSTVIKFGQDFVASGSITGTQLLFDGGFLMGVKGAKEYVNMSKVNLRRNNIETVVTISTVYYRCLALQTNIMLIEKNLATITKSRDDAEANYKAGLVEKLVYDRALFQYSTWNLDFARAKDNYAISLLVLKLQMGMNLNDSILLTDDFETMYKNNTPLLTETKVDYTKRTEIQILDQNITLNTLNKKRYQFGYAPTLMAVASTQRNTFGSNFSDLGTTWFPGTYWGLNLSVPIFNGMRKSSQIQQSKIEIEKAENQKSFMIMNVDKEVLQAKQVYLRASQQINIQKANLELAEEIYKTIQVKSESGISSSYELTNALNDLEKARVNYISTVNDFFVAQLEYRRAIGDIN